MSQSKKNSDSEDKTANSKNKDAAVTHMEDAEASAQTAPSVSTDTHEESNDATAHHHAKQDEEKLQKILKNHVVLTGAAGLIPTPIVDLASITAIQANMIKEISNHFGVEFKENLVRNSIGALATGTGLVSVGTSLMKTIPVLGTFGGMLTMPIIASASTYALGKVFIEHYKKGGTLIDFDSETVKGEFKKEYQRGKKVAANLKQEILLTSKSKKS